MVFRKYEDLIGKDIDVDKEIQFLSNSEIRLKVLANLVNGPMSMRRINEITFLSYSSISNNVHKLEKRGFIEKRFGEYHLTNKGIIHLFNILDFHDSLSIVNHFSDFWGGHNVKPLGISSLSQLPLLKGSKIIESVPIDIYKTHNELTRLIKTSKSVKIIFPYLHPEYPKLIRDMVIKGAKIEVLVPQDILPRFLEDMGELILRRGIENETLSIRYLKENLQLALAVSKDFVAIGLYKFDGTYDQNRLLVSNKHKTIDWAFGIYDYYDSKSLRCSLKDFNFELDGE